MNIILNKLMINNTKIKGFMLLELMLSIVILGIVLIVCLQSASSIVKSSTSANNINTAGFLFNQLLYKINYEVFDSNETTGDFGEKYPNFKWKIKTVPINEYLNQVNMFILWKEHGKTKDLEIITLSNKFKKM